MKVYIQLAVDMAIARASAILCSLQSLSNGLLSMHVNTSMVVLVLSRNTLY